MVFFPKVSIVIPVYNGSNYMREAIDSALAQAYENIEIIVVNDGSTDNGATAKIANSYGDRIRYFSKKNGGVATALNMGIREMTGEYFSWLSHDDIYYPHKIEAQIEYLKNSKKKMVLYSDFEFIDHASIFLRSHCIDNIEPIMFKYALITGNPIHGCTALLPKSCFEECGLFDETLITTQDYDMWFRLSKRYSFIHIPHKLIKSRLHDEQGSRVIKEHSREITEFYIKCLNDIYHPELVDECGESLSVLYSKIAINLKTRKYSEASKCALTFSKKTIKKNSAKSYLIFVFFIIHWHVLHQWMKLFVIFKIVMKLLRKKHPIQFDNNKSLNDEILAKKSIQCNIKAHDSFVANYDIAHVEIYNPIEQRRISQELKEAVSQIRTSSKKTLVMDFRAGTGNLTHHLLNLNMDVLAADVSEKSLERLESKVNSGNQLQTTILNGLDLSQFKDNTFDMIATYSVLHHVPDYLRIIKEFLRVVKPGGLIYIDHEVCPLYWYKNKDYQRYLKELGSNFSENHLLKLGVKWRIKFLIRLFMNLFPKIISIKSWKNLLKKKLNGANNYPAQTSDIHVFKYDHIEWDEIKHILLPRSEIIKENDYIVCRERSEQPAIWKRWNSKCTDMRLLIARKI